MQKTVSLKADKREMSITADMLRVGNKIPAECYGGGKDNVSIQLDYQAFRKAFIKAGENTLIELDVDGSVEPVLVQEIQFNPVTDKITHVDFVFIDMKKEVTTNIPVYTEGVAPAVRDMGGILTLNLTEIEVKCLPADIPHEFVVDVSVLDDFHSAIHVSDLNVPEGVELLNELEQTIATVAPPRAEEEEELDPEEAEAEAIAELAGEEGEEGAEGEGGEEASAEEGGEAAEEGGSNS